MGYLIASALLVVIAVMVSVGLGYQTETERLTYRVAQLDGLSDTLASYSNLQEAELNTMEGLLRQAKIDRDVLAESLDNAERSLESLGDIEPVCGPAVVWFFGPDTGAEVPIQFCAVGATFLPYSTEQSVPEGTIEQSIPEEVPSVY
jgi:hypothetical protein